jgi:hypothetical protein
VGVHQGIAVSDDYIYLFDTSSIKKLNKNWEQVAVNTDVNTECGVNHLGDGCYYDGYLYVPTENFVGCSPGDNTGMQISRWNADTLAYVDSFSVSAQMAEVSSVCIDAASDRIYVSSYCDGTQLYIYKLSDHSYVGTLALSASITSIQGISYKDPYFYICKDGTGVYEVTSTGTVLQIIWATANEGIDFCTDTLYCLNANGTSIIYSLLRDPDI